MEKINKNKNVHRAYKYKAMIVVEGNSYIELITFIDINGNKNSIKMTKQDIKTFVKFKNFLDNF